MSGSLFYVVSYTAIARNVSAAELASALAAIPRDTLYESTIGVTALADSSTSFSGLYARRSISYTSNASAVAPDDELGSFLVNLYTSKFSQGLSTRVIAAPVVVVPRPLPPSLWVNAQYGVTAASDAWADMAGNVNGLIQPVPVNVPLFEPDGFAPDVATVRFAGGAKFYRSINNLSFDDFTYLVTFRSPLLSTPGMLFERSVDATAHSGERLYQAQAPTHTILARRAGVVHSGDYGALAWAVDGNWHQVAFVYAQGAGAKLFVDGVLSTSFLALGAEVVSDLLFVGAQAAGTLPITGDVRELFVFPSALTSDQLTSMAAYMNAQVGL